MVVTNLIFGGNINLSVAFQEKAAQLLHHNHVIK